MRLSRSLLALAVLAAALPACALGDIFNGGCGYDRPAGIEKSDLVGVFAAAGGGELTLNADGTFVAKDLRRKDHDEDRMKELSGTGTWELKDRGGRTDRAEDYADVPLTFVAADGSTMTWFRVDIKGSPITYNTGEVGFGAELYYLHGDSCEIVLLQRVGQAPRRPAPTPQVTKSRVIR